MKNRTRTAQAIYNLAGRILLYMFYCICLTAPRQLLVLSWDSRLRRTGKQQCAKAGIKPPMKKGSARTTCTSCMYFTMLCVIPIELHVAHDAEPSCGSGTGVLTARHSMGVQTIPNAMGQSM